MIENLKNVLFVTYGDNNFKNSKQVLYNEALNFGFSKFCITSPDHLSTEFKQQHLNFFAKSTRGGGYWLWKPYIIKESLNLINMGDFLLYADAGCSININGKNRFLEWLEMCNSNNSLSFQMNHLQERQWTKMDVIHYLNCNSSKYLNTGQINATTFLLKKTIDIVDLIDEWLKICSLEWTINDSISKIQNDIEFKDHRHDQSIFSLLRKKRKCLTISDETYPDSHNWQDECIKYVPVLATRRRL